MNMYLNTIFRIYPTKKEETILKQLIVNFENQVNKVIKLFQENGSIKNIPFKEIDNDIPWDSKIEVIKQARIDYAKLEKKISHRNHFEYNYCKWTNLNFTYFNDQKLLIETFRKEVMILNVFCNDFVRDKLNNNKLVSLKIFKRKNKWIGSITYYHKEKINYKAGIMGIDLGILVPAVAVTSNDKIRFFGNGREKRFIQIKQKSIHSKIVIKNKEDNVHCYNSWSNRLKYIDHKISKDIISFALNNDIGLIKMESLGRIQKRNSHSQKVSTWSYHRLMHYIIYKAKQHGIIVVLVDPFNTSRKCPQCAKINVSIKRQYQCDCGYKAHRDIVGALNILNSPYSQKTSL